MQDRILTPEQVAELLQLHPFTILSYIKDGRLQAARLGRVYRIRESAVNAFLENQMVAVEKTT
jgi:excisionase family DNA binding protein